MLPRRAWLVCGLFGIVMLALAAVWPVRAVAVEAVPIGNLDAFVPGSVTRVQLSASFDDPQRPHYRRGLPLAIPRESAAQIVAAAQLALQQELKPSVGRVAPVSVFLVRDPRGVVRALYDRDPLTACQLDWKATVQRFEDRCSYSAYALDGRYLRGPAERGLDRFAVAISGTGDIAVDVSRYQPGLGHS